MFLWRVFIFAVSALSGSKGGASNYRRRVEGEGQGWGLFSDYRLPFRAIGNSRGIHQLHSEIADSAHNYLSWQAGGAGAGGVALSGNGLSGKYFEWQLF